MFKISHPWLLHCIFIFFLLPPPSTAAPTAAPTAAQALLNFKHSLSHGGALSSWGRNPNFCNWEGIQCSSNLTTAAAAAAVTGLLLSNKNISGDLSAAVSLLAPLRRLRRLDLSSNDFSGGPLPSTFSAIAAVTHLNFSFCNLAGAIPAAVANLSSLQSLDLSWNFAIFSDDLQWLQTLSSLRFLDLSTVNLTTVSDWQKSITNLSSLTDLSLSWCYLSSSQNLNLSFPPLISLNLPANQFESSIFSWIYGFKQSLVELDLSYNQITSVPVSMADFCKLQELRIAGNNISQELPEIFMAISGCIQPTLTLLDLDDNEIQGSLPDLPKFSSLTFLHLSRNHISNPLRNDLLLPPSLLLLDLGSNSIHGPLPDPTVFSPLRELYLGSNQLNGSIEPGLTNLSRLELLDLSFNYLTSTLTESHLAGLSCLRHLDLSGNQLSLHMNPGWVPPFRLDVIGLRGCHLGPGFPSWLTSQMNYSVLDVSVTGISGDVPASFWRLSPIFHYLNLSGNGLTGRVPGLGSVAGIEPIIDLSYNGFSGSVPTLPPGTTSISLSGNSFSGSVNPTLCTGRLGSIGNIDLSVNRLSGEVPDCFHGMVILTILRLNGNRFSGSVPESLRSLSQLESLHLQKNSFSGAFPPGLESCTKLKVLDLSGNRFSGKIPAWVGGTLLDLIVLSLRENLLDGSIPYTVCDLSQLHVLDMSRNALTGSIPTCLNNLTAMAEPGDDSTIQIDQLVSYNDFQIQEAYTGYIDSEHMIWKGAELEYKNTLGLVRSIDLSGNRLTGEIPDGITSLGELVGLNLSRNTLSGIIPSDIGRLRALDLLDLSRNELTGGIPTSLSEVHGLGALDLSYNKLRGGVPESTQLQSFNESAFEGNPGLCGAPLAVKCGLDLKGLGQKGLEPPGSTGTGFGLGFGFGFGIGFWCVCGPLLFFKSLRQKYFWFLGSLSWRLR